MANVISSRTPEGWPNRCPFCASVIVIEASQPYGDAPCPNCGVLLWFFPTSAGTIWREAAVAGPLWERIVASISDFWRKQGAECPEITPGTSVAKFFDSLDLVELVLELEEDFGQAIPAEELSALQTLGDLLDHLIKHVGDQGTAD